MPPKVRFTKENIVQTAFEIARTEGAENINVRTVSKKLGCSTQPIMYHFKNIDELKNEVYQKADDYHTDYITDIDGNAQDMLKIICLRYIQFAVEERNLFRFLFRSEYAKENSLMDAIGSDEDDSVSGLLQQSLNISRENSRLLFRQMFMFIHGYACFLSDHLSTFNEKEVENDLDFIVTSLVSSLK